MIGTVVLAVLLLLVVGALVDDDPTDPDPGATQAAVESRSPAAPTTAGETALPGPPGFDDGTYLVGTEIQPGLYRSDGGTFCRWQRLRDLSGDWDAVLAWEFADGQAYAEVLPTDAAFSTDDCGRWVPASADGPDVSGGFGDGTYLVGSEIQPGTYRATGGSFCSWERLSDLTGDHDAVIGREFAEGQSYVEISASDVAFSTDGCGTWSRIA